MKTDLNNEEYPRLVPPEVVYEHKASLKKPVVVPLYAKIVAAAAAVALLFGIFWHRTALPEQELVAALEPVEAVRVETEEPWVLAESQARFIVPVKAMKPSTTAEEQQTEKAEIPLLAELQPKAAPMLLKVEYQPDALLPSDVYYAYNETVLHEEDDDNLSLLRRGIYKMTDGEHDSFAGIISEGLQSVKTEMALFATTIQSSRSQLRQMVR